MSEWDRPPAGLVPPPQEQVQLRVGWMIPPQRHADFGLGGDWQSTTDDARVKLERPTCDVRHDTKSNVNHT